MDWTFLILVAVLWLVSPVILLIALIVARRQVRVVRDQLASQRGGEPPPTAVHSTPLGSGMVGGNSRYAPVDLENLLLLRLELQRLAGSSDLTEDRHRQLAGELDRACPLRLHARSHRPYRRSLPTD